MKGRRKTYLIISIDIEQVFDKCSWRTRNTKPTANTIFNDKISKTSLRSILGAATLKGIPFYAFTFWCCIVGVKKCSRFLYIGLVSCYLAEFGVYASNLLYTYALT